MIESIRGGGAQKAGLRPERKQLVKYKIPYSIYNIYSHVHDEMEQIVIIKLGGAAITFKDRFEALNTKVLEECAQVVASLFHEKRLKVIIVHGAGSFGHFQASKYKLAGGSPDSSLTTSTQINLGFSQTHQSVRQLNLHVVQSLIELNVPAVSISPLCSWTTDNSQITQDSTVLVQQMLGLGLVPVLHGDAIFDTSMKYTILSGDSIIRRLCENLHPRPARAVFFTNVSGIFDKPPVHHYIGDSNLELLHNSSETKDLKAVLLRKIIVDIHSTSEWTAIDINGRELSKDSILMDSMVEIDVTGGIEKKVSEAAAIATYGIPVRIVLAGKSQDCFDACYCDMLDDHSSWIGTEVISTTL